MLPFSPLSLRARILLLQLTFQCRTANQRLLQCRHASSAGSPQGSKPPISKTQSSNLQAPKSSETKEEEHVPKPLTRPLGLPNPPRPGQNNGRDIRTWRERRDDFLNYDKHLERRKQLTKAVAKPYFRDWSNMRFSKGKTFLSSTKLFRADKALYFPNLQGITLASPKEMQDTTPILTDKVSIVSMFSGTWAEHQTASFAGDNPELNKALEESRGVAQRVDINVEENALKAGLIKMFISRIRKRLPGDRHDKYFLVTQGITEEMRDGIGLLNSKVGYVYLVDRRCRIRWAGSGPANAEEREGLVRGVKKLVQEHQGLAEPSQVQEGRDSPGTSFGAAVATA